MCGALADVRFEPITDIGSLLLLRNKEPKHRAPHRPSWLHGFQKRGEVFHLGIGETDVEAQIVEIHDIQQRCG